MANFTGDQEIHSVSGRCSDNPGELVLMSLLVQSVDTSNYLFSACLFTQGHSQDFSKGGGSHCVKHYHHGVFTMEYCRFVVCLKKKPTKGVHGHRRTPLAMLLLLPP